MNTQDITVVKSKLKYRASYRGTKEMDIIFKKYVIDEIDMMDEDELMTLAELLEIPDQILMPILMGQHDVPDYINNSLLQELIEKLKLD